MPNGVFSGSAGAAMLAVFLAFAPNSLLAAPSSAAMAAAPSAQAPRDKLGQLAAALAADMKDVRLQASAADLDAGKPAKASLVLPRGLLDRIRAEAAKLDLDEAAGRVAIRAKLSGDGYDISPDRKESLRLASNRAVGFHWKVALKDAAPGPLSIHLTGVLHGDGPSKSFVLGDVVLGASPAPVAAVQAPTAAPTPPAAAPVPAQTAMLTTVPGEAAPSAYVAHAKARAHKEPREHVLSRLKLPSFSAPDLSGVQIFGHKLSDLLSASPLPPQKLAMGGGLLALAIVLWAVALGAARRKARDERRRRFRTFEPPRYWSEPGREA